MWGNAAMIGGVQDVHYFVADMERAVRFYRDTLHLVLTRQAPHWSSFDVGGVRFGLHWTGGAPVPPVPRAPDGARAGGTVTFRVADLATAVARLRASGVTILGDIATADWGRVVAIEDPDANVLKLMEPPPTT